LAIGPSDQLLNQTDSQLLGEMQGPANRIIALTTQPSALVIPDTAANTFCNSKLTGAIQGTTVKGQLTLVHFGVVQTDRSGSFSLLKAGAISRHLTIPTCSGYVTTHGGAYTLYAVNVKNGKVTVATDKIFYTPCNRTQLVNGTKQCAG